MDSRWFPTRPFLTALKFVHNVHSKVFPSADFLTYCNKSSGDWKLFPERGHIKITSYALCLHELPFPSLCCRFCHNPHIHTDTGNCLESAWTPHGFWPHPSQCGWTAHKYQLYMSWPILTLILDKNQKYIMFLTQPN